MQHKVKILTSLLEQKFAWRWVYWISLRCVLFITLIIGFDVGISGIEIGDLLTVFMLLILISGIIVGCGPVIGIVLIFLPFYYHVLEEFCQYDTESSWSRRNICKLSNIEWQQLESITKKMLILISIVFLVALIYEMIVVFQLKKKHNANITSDAEKLFNKKIKNWNISLLAQYLAYYQNINDFHKLPILV